MNIQQDVFIDYANARYLIENKWFPFGTIATTCLNFINSLSDYEKYYRFMKWQYNNSPIRFVNKETGKEFSDQELKEKFENEQLVYKYMESYLSDLLNPANYNLWFWFNNRLLIEQEYKYSDKYLELFSKEDNEIWKNNAWQEMEQMFSSLSDYESYISSKVSWIGTQTFTIDEQNINLVHIKIHDISDLYSSDFNELLYNPKVLKPKYCISCNSLFVPINQKEKYCSCCRDEIHKINYNKVKNNPAKKLHKNILNYYNVVIHEKGTSETVTKFRNESNYYSAVVQGKKPKTKKLKSYQNIKTESEYISWLENFYQELKQNHTNR